MATVSPKTPSPSLSTIVSAWVVGVVGCALFSGHATDVRGHVSVREGAEVLQRDGADGRDPAHAGHDWDAREGCGKGSAVDPGDAD